jgi:hypothetical protein
MYWCESWLENERKKTNKGKTSQVLIQESDAVCDACIFCKSKTPETPLPLKPPSDRMAAAQSWICWTP